MYGVFIIGWRRPLIIGLFYNSKPSRGSECPICISRSVCRHQDAICNNQYTFQKCISFFPVACTPLRHIRWSSPVHLALPQRTVPVRSVLIQPFRQRLQFHCPALLAPLCPFAPAPAVPLFLAAAASSPSPFALCPGPTPSSPAHADESMKMHAFIFIVMSFDLIFILHAFIFFMHSSSYMTMHVFIFIFICLACIFMR